MGVKENGRWWQTTISKAFLEWKLYFHESLIHYCIMHGFGTKWNNMLLRKPKHWKRRIVNLTTLSSLVSKTTAYSAIYEDKVVTFDEGKACKQRNYTVVNSGSLFQVILTEWHINVTGKYVITGSDIMTSHSISTSYYLNLWRTKSIKLRSKHKKFFNTKLLYFSLHRLFHHNYFW